MQQSLLLPTLFLGFYFSSGCVSKQSSQAPIDYGLKYSQKNFQAMPGALPLRPFRSGLIKLSPELDAQKPLAQADFAGWVAANNYLIGSPEPKWIAAYLLPHIKPSWWLQAPDDLTAPPKVSGNQLLLGFRDGSLWNVNLKTGQPTWKQKISSFATREMRLLGNTLLIVTANQTLYALNSENGSIKWIYDAKKSETLSIHNTSAPTVYKKMIFFGLSSGEVAAVDFKTGEGIWSHSPAFSDSRFHDAIGEIMAIDTIIITARFDGIISAINIDKPKKEVGSWKSPKKISSITAAKFRHGRFYVGTHNGFIHAFNPRTGQELWKSQIGTSINNISTGESNLYVSASDGRICSLDSNTGKIIWHDQVEGNVVGKPLYINRNIFFQTGLNVFYGYKL